MSTLKRFALIVTIVILTACSAPVTPTVTPQPPTPTVSADLATLAQNRQKWDALKAAHYSFKLAVGCFCAFRDQMPLNIEVKDGKVVSMLDNKGQPVEQFADLFDTYNTIEKLFGKLDEALNGGADKTTVTYNAEKGYPESIYIDYIEQAADDEINFTVTDLAVLP
jgi:hypothetical protein